MKSKHQPSQKKTDEGNGSGGILRVIKVSRSLSPDLKRSHKAKMPNPKYKRFDVYWWVANDGPELCRYATLQPTDIQQFSATHFRIVAHQLDAEYDDIELILRKVKGHWTFKSDSFAEVSEDYPIAFASTDKGAVWTEALDDEMMVIKATF